MPIEEITLANMDSIKLYEFALYAYGIKTFF